MNKEEAIEKIEELKKYSCGALGDDWISLGIDKALNVVKQLDEPKKPVVPQYVADFYESIKDNFEYNLYQLCIQYKDNSDELSDEIWAWFDDSDNESLQTLNKMKLFGYEIEEIEIFWKVKMMNKKAKTDFPDWWNDITFEVVEKNNDNAVSR